MKDFTHPKFSPIAVGTTDKYECQQCKYEDIDQYLREMPPMYRPGQDPDLRPEWAYINYGVHKMPIRENAQKDFIALGGKFVNHNVRWTTYMEHLTQAKFMVSPPGNT